MSIWLTGRGSDVIDNVPKSYLISVGLQTIPAACLPSDVSMDNMEHGIIVGGTHFFFSEALNELGREAGITALFKKNCKKVGIPIK